VKTVGDKVARHWLA